MKRHLLTTLGVLILSAAVGGHGAPASAGVTDTFTITPAVINAGQTAQLDVTLTLTADSGYYNPNFAGGSITISSGYGPDELFNIGYGGTSEEFSVDYTYPASGLFTPSVAGNVNYTQNYTYYGITGYTEYQYLISGGYYYSCGFFEECYQGPTYGYGYYADYGYLTGYNSQDAVIDYSGSLSVVPEPASIALLGVGLLGTGVMARRRQSGTTSTVG